MVEPLLLLLVLGVNIILWTLIGGFRLTSERLGGAVSAAETSRAGHQQLTPNDVAVLIPAHNEEPVIAATIESALRQVPASNIHVVADGCEDATAEIARAAGTNVLELQPGRGKAGGIESAVKRFDLPRRFAVLLILDADTELDDNYLECGLPMFDQPDVVALAGYAKASWRPDELTPLGRLLVAYRSRLYAVMQWLKYGQTWRWTNVTAIVPGFASMYRTNVLDAMDLNPPGLIIEDFNMTFEIHRKRLGKIAFRPAVQAMTQDPDNFRDYYRQVKRWHLGFWQTIRRHGFWASWFSAALVFFLVEVLFAAIGILLLVGGLVALGVIALVGFAGQTAGWLTEQFAIVQFLPVVVIALLIIAAIDYFLTCLTALAFRRPSLLLYGLGFVPMRFIDATATLWAIPQAWRAESSGQWTSPTRRPVTAAEVVSGPGHDSGAVPATGADGTT